jgi:exopolysaccharide biosynthesis polyprenyl glycosylphosphotransferase
MTATDERNRSEGVERGGRHSSIRFSQPAALSLTLGATAAVLMLLTRRPDVMLVGAATLAIVAFAATRQLRRPTRILVLGSSRSAAALGAELAASVGRLELVGRVGVEPPPGPDPHWLGPLSDLRGIVRRHDIDLLLLSSGEPRMRVFDELESSCQDLSVRMCELSAFYEDEFGYVPIAEINSAWFQCVRHPRQHFRPSRAKRVIDIALSAPVALTFAPALLLIALIVRRDGSPALYRQVRIGEQGRPFTILKLRTMRVQLDGDTTWSRAGDDRVTRIGAFLRRSHLDELPQLLNVLRGEMSLVGPRPEQPQYVEQLERSVRFYSRRHQLRPGLTGWAQLHCGYAGSERGTAWKLSHDLFYLRHRSLSLDLKILAMTLTAPFSRHQFAELEHRPLVFGTLVDEPGVDPQMRFDRDFGGAEPAVGLAPVSP